MRLTAIKCVLVAMAGVLGGISSAEACSCGDGGSLAESVEAAGVLFIGRVKAVENLTPMRDNGDGSVTVFAGSTPERSTFDVLRAFRGSATALVQMTSAGGGCDLPFRKGETWLVYGRVTPQGIKTDKCHRTRLLSRARPDIAFLEGAEASRPQGVVFGKLLRRGLLQGRVQLTAPERSAPLVVVAMSGTRRIEVDADWSSYQLVLPPGSAQIWVELAGRAVMAPVSVEVTDRGQHRMMLVVEYPD
jgi:hypothetical protein